MQFINENQALITQLWTEENCGFKISKSKNSPANYDKTTKNEAVLLRERKGRKGNNALK
jgi:hypothetical protein